MKSWGLAGSRPRIKKCIVKLRKLQGLGFEDFTAGDYRLQETVINCSVSAFGFPVTDQISKGRLRHCVGLKIVGGRLDCSSASFFHFFASFPSSFLTCSLPVLVSRLPSRPSCFSVCPTCFSSFLASCLPCFLSLCCFFLLILPCAGWGGRFSCDFCLYLHILFFDPYLFLFYAHPDRKAPLATRLKPSSSTFACWSLLLPVWRSYEWCSLPEFRT